jgi:uncharacterized protein YggU (UPF0235/DUF167 family)
MYIRVHAVPDARRGHVREDASQVYTISVKEPAAQNRANERIREILADLHGLPPRHVRLVTGHRSSSKLFSVDEKER